MRTYFTHTHERIYITVLYIRSHITAVVAVCEWVQYVQCFTIYIYIGIYNTYIRGFVLRSASPKHILSARRVCIKRYTCPGWGRGGKKINEKKKKNYKTKQSRFSSSSAAFYSQTLKPSKAINYTNRLRVTAKIYLLSALFILLLLLLLLLLLFLYYISFFFFL